MRKSLREIISDLAQKWLWGQNQEQYVIDQLSGSTTDCLLEPSEWAAAAAGVVRELQRDGYHAEAARLASELYDLALAST